MTWNDVVTASLKRINVIQANETPSPTDAADAFLRLQDWVESILQNDALTIPFLNRTTWTISATKGTLASPYTVGTGGDVSFLRPTILDDIRYQDTSTSPTTERSLVVLTDDAWEKIPQKNLTATLPQYAYYNPTYASSLGSLYLWPVPSQSNLQGVLYSPAGIAKPAALTDTILLPPGYLRFIRDNLAVELASEWRDSLPADPGLIKSAAESKAAIKRINMRPLDMTIDNALTSPKRGCYDINVGP